MVSRNHFKATNLTNHYTLDRRGGGLLTLLNLMMRRRLILLICTYFSNVRGLKTTSESLTIKRITSEWREICNQNITLSEPFNSSRDEVVTYIVQYFDNKSHFMDFCESVE